MNTTIQITNSIYGILVFLSSFAALWIAGRIVLRNLTESKRGNRIIIWLALSGLILIPLTDFLRYVYYILSLVLFSGQNLGDITVVFGFGSYPLYLIITLVVGLVTYGVVYVYAQKATGEGNFHILQDLDILNWESTAVLLGLAGLVLRVVQGLVVNFVSLELPTQALQQRVNSSEFGFWVSWMVGILILLVTLSIMNGRLIREDEDRDEDAEPS